MDAGNTLGTCRDQFLQETPSAAGSLGWRLGCVTETQWSEVAVSQLQRMDMSEPKEGQLPILCEREQGGAFPTLPPCVATKAPQVITDWFL